MKVKKKSQPASFQLKVYKSINFKNMKYIEDCRIIGKIPSIHNYSNLSRPSINLLVFLCFYLVTLSIFPLTNLYIYKVFSDFNGEIIGQRNKYGRRIDK